MRRSKAEIANRSICAFCQVDDDGRHRAFGSGFFFMQPNLVATARHVIEDVMASRRPTYVMNATGSRARPTHAWFPAEHGIDLALVRCDGPHFQAPHTPLYPASFRMNREGGHIAIGLSLGRSNLDQRNWALEGNYISQIEEASRERSNSTEWVLDFEHTWMAGGFSGGPVLCTGGGVIGVLIQVFGEDRRHGRATSILPLVECFRSPFEGAGEVIELDLPYPPLPSEPATPVDSL